jgi:sugar lactone lactonase YvrE
MNELEHVLSVQNELGESPRWNAGEQALYWVDILGRRLYRYHPATGDGTSFDMGLPVGAAGFRASGGLVLAAGDGFALWDPQGRELQYIARLKMEKPDARLNDAASDRQGRFWGGTVDDNTNYLYRLDPDHTVNIMEEGITLSNGLGWSRDDRTMYFTDTQRQTIFAYDFDPATGSISNKRVFVSTAAEEGSPDGLTVDAEGYVWSARWGGWKVVRYSPLGEVDLEIRLPVANPTSCTFGGPDLDDLYITTAWGYMSVEERAQQPLAGDLFRIKVAVKGMPEPHYLG